MHTQNYTLTKRTELCLPSVTGPDGLYGDSNTNIICQKKRIDFQIKIKQKKHTSVLLEQKTLTRPNVLNFDKEILIQVFFRP